MTTAIAARTPRKAFPTIPHTLELSTLFSDFLSYWSGLESRFLEGSPAQGPADPVELIVRWNGSVNGALVLRASKTLLRKLTMALGEKGQDFHEPMAAFREMATLYATYLAHSLWVDEFFELGPILSRPSSPRDWPSRTQCHAYSALSVDGDLLEIRFWLDPQEIPVAQAG